MSDRPTPFELLRDRYSDLLAGEVIQITRDFAELLLQENDLRGARIAALEAERRWIPVKEQQPERGEPILGQLRAGGAIVVWWYEHGGGNGWASDGPCFSPDDVTHWMPLPEPPAQASAQAPEPKAE